MTDERFDDFLKTMLDEVEPVPPAPREEMWARVQQQRRFTRQARTRRTWMSWGVGLAAMLAIGVGIGRVSVKQAAPPISARDTNAAAPATARSTAYRLAVAQYMTSAEALLTTFRTQPQGTLDPEIAVWARDLLTNTRLLLDSPAGEDPKVAALLEDLELIIAQIARLSAPSSEENQIIREGMRKTEVLPRLRATLPAVPTAAGT